MDQTLRRRNPSTPSNNESPRNHLVLEVTAESDEEYHDARDYMSDPTEDEDTGEEEEDEQVETDQEFRAEVKRLTQSFGVLAVLESFFMFMTFRILLAVAFVSFGVGLFWAGVAIQCERGRRFPIATTWFKRISIASLFSAQMLVVGTIVGALMNDIIEKQLSHPSSS